MTDPNPGRITHPGPSDSHCDHSERPRPAGALVEVAVGSPRAISWRKSVLPALAFFGATFGAWTQPGILAPFVAISEGERGWPHATLAPLTLLFGAVGRMVVGWLFPRVDPKKLTLALASQAVFGSILLVRVESWHTPLGSIAAAFLLGAAGSTFPLVIATTIKSVALSRRGTALGVVGMGNAGSTVLAVLAALVASKWGWQTLPWMTSLACAGAAAWYLTSLRHQPSRSPAKGLDRNPQRLCSHPEKSRRDGGWISCISYTVAFGSFVGISSSIPLLATFGGLDPKVAAALGGGAALAGTLARPLGGALSDRVESAKATATCLAVVATAIASTALVGGYPMASADAPTPVGSVLSSALLVLAASWAGAGAGASLGWLGKRSAEHVSLLTGVAGATGAAWGAGVSKILLAAADDNASWTASSVVLTFATFAAAAIALSGRLLSSFATRSTRWSSQIGDRPSGDVVYRGHTPKAPGAQDGLFARF